MTPISTVYKGSHSLFSWLNSLMKINLEFMYYLLSNDVLEFM